MKLNKNQQLAVDHFEGCCIVTSVPGSGKTRTIVERVFRLIERLEGLDDVAPINILSITFTNKAAREMKERIQERLGGNSLPFFVGTFHSLCARILRKGGYHIGYTENFTIIDSDDQINTMRQLVRKTGAKWEERDVRHLVKVTNDARENMFNKAELDRNLAFDPRAPKIMRLYLDHLRKMNCIDFSGLLSETVRLLEEHPRVADKLRERFRYIQVDEFQDTNLIQFHLIELLYQRAKDDPISHDKSLFVVGDVNQSIYRFRGARYRNIHDFIERHKDTQVVHLPLNYRSTPQIIAPADKLIRLNESFIGGEFTTDNAEGPPVSVQNFADQDKEAGWLAHTIGKLVSEGGWEAADIAVLYRLNSMSAPIETALTKYQIPYEVIGGRSFYARKEIKDCLAIMKFLANKKDGIAFGRICMLMKGLGSVTVGQIENLSDSNDIDLVEACRVKGNSSGKIATACNKLADALDQDQGSEVATLSDVISELNLRGVIRDKFDGDDAEDRCNNVDQLITSLGDYSKNGKGVDEFLQMIALITSSDKEATEGRVSLMTLHASKGLEFPIVFMVGFENSILPHSRSINEDPVEGEEEERRLAYVGITRPMNVLYISYCRMRVSFYGSKRNEKMTGPSPFLFEAGLLNNGR